VLWRRGATGCVAEEEGVEGKSWRNMELGVARNNSWGFKIAKVVPRRKD